MQFLKHYGFTR